MEFKETVGLENEVGEDAIMLVLDPGIFVIVGKKINRHELTN